MTLLNFLVTINTENKLKRRKRLSMAKVTFNKLGLSKNLDKKNIEINEQVIEVKQYLPVEEKLELISHVVNKAHDQDYNFSNPVKVEVFAGIEIVKYYTNITFTEKQLEEAAKTYDLLNANHIIDTVIGAIPQAEYIELKNGIEQTIESIYKYQNSILGILDTIGEDYSNLDLDVTQITDKIKDPESLKLVKDVLTKLG